MATPRVKKLKEDICRAVGHDCTNDAFVCNRCGLDTLLSRLAWALSPPLRVTLDYQGIARKLIKVDNIKPGYLPIYDKDI